MPHASACRAQESSCLSLHRGRQLHCRSTSARSPSTGRACDRWFGRDYLLSGDNVTADFDAANRTIVRFEWRTPATDGSIDEIKLCSNVSIGTPPKAAFAVPDECKATKCA